MVIVRARVCVLGIDFMTARTRKHTGANHPAHACWLKLYPSAHKRNIHIHAHNVCMLCACEHTHMSKKDCSVGAGEHVRPHDMGTARCGADRASDFAGKCALEYIMCVRAGGERERETHMCAKLYPYKSDMCKLDI